MGITKEGQPTEDLVLSLCASARKLDKTKGERSRDGDLVVKQNSNEFFIEVKKNTWNQTRPSKYIPVVGYNESLNMWFVVPPDELLELVVERNGQHTKNPFVCVGFKPNDSKKWQKYACEPQTLEAKIHAAISQGEKNTTMKEVAKTLRLNETIRVEEDRKLVREALA